MLPEATAGSNGRNGRRKRRRQQGEDGWGRDEWNILCLGRGKLLYLTHQRSPRARLPLVFALPYLTWDAIILILTTFSPNRPPIYILSMPVVLSPLFWPIARSLLPETHGFLHRDHQLLLQVLEVVVRRQIQPVEANSPSQYSPIRVHLRHRHTMCATWAKPPSARNSRW